MTRRRPEDEEDDDDEDWDDLKGATIAVVIVVFIFGMFVWVASLPGTSTDLFDYGAGYLLFENY
jgi:hypothetical protein